MHNTINDKMFLNSLLMLMSATISTIVCVPIDDNAQLFQAIANSVNTNNTEKFYEHRTEVCYQDLGCFYLEGPMKQTNMLPSSLEKINTQFFIYYRSGQVEEQIVDPYNSSTFKKINRSKQLVIIVHGFNNDHKVGYLVRMKDAILKYLKSKIGAVIMVDWSGGSAIPFYRKASCNTQVVGRQITFLVDRLKHFIGLDPLSVHLIGFSLGAQASGFAGKHARKVYGWTYGRITGLDAAAPMFEGYEGSYLTFADARFVDAIHTSAGKHMLKGEVGFIGQYGHEDFYPNGGLDQPMCTGTADIACNHKASVLYFAVSIEQPKKCPFSAYPCSDWVTYKNNTCLNPDARMGYYSIDGKGSGDHFLSMTTKSDKICYT
ncbi:hypothetical protein RDWZM_010255 [Blomia tropicalis]|uniref:Lipase domain-containing protein n=1 Tax=Blomia tropicalis TaxID=40697 RepID=A0A9Q0RIV8_BLOTA|nr:hypothetical protein RDWZM_010255 [Blomia tropicalis]